MKWGGLVLVIGGCVTAPVVAPVSRPCPEPVVAAVVQSSPTVRAALAEFVSAVEARDFLAVWRRLDARWRSQYTPQRLELDFLAEPGAVGLVSRIKAALPFEVRVDGTRAFLSVTPSQVVSLSLEADGWHVSELEAPAP